MGTLRKWTGRAASTLAALALIAANAGPVQAAQILSQPGVFAVEFPVTPSPSLTPTPTDPTRSADPTAPVPVQTGPVPSETSATTVPQPSATPSKSVAEKTALGVQAVRDGAAAAAVTPPLGAETSITSAWTALSGLTGPLGSSTADIVCGLADNGCYQTFQKGDIYWSGATGAHPVWGANLVAYRNHGTYSGGLRYPTNSEVCGLLDGGCSQTFQGGQLFWSPATGSTPVWGANRVAYVNYGAQNGGLRYPTGPETCGLRDGGCSQNFQAGQLFWSPTTGSTPVWGANRVAYVNHGAQNGGLRYPTGPETCGLRDGGCSQNFQGGQLFWSPNTGANTVWGAIGATWTGRGGPSGSLGYPTETENCWAGGCQQWFENGSVSWTPVSGPKLYISPGGYCEAINRGSVNYGTGGAQRVTFAIAEQYSTSPVTSVTCVKSAGRYVYEWSTWAQAGESGFARPGVASGPTINKFSPTGSFTVTDAFGLGNPGTALNYVTLNPYSRWGGRLNANYNKYFESSADIFPDENMWYYATRPAHDYRQGVVINYNRPPDSAITMDAGFAIFLHANRYPSWGCIAMNEPDVVHFMTNSIPGDRIVMGVVADVFR
jgi:L,D-peptidoglycan transpeptidase YkuD (ErfK/YbiS/YcfS/YnhG family)